MQRMLPACRAVESPYPLHRTPTAPPRQKPMLIDTDPPAKYSDYVKRTIPGPQTLMTKRDPATRVLGNEARGANYLVSPKNESRISKTLCCGSPPWTLFAILSAHGDLLRSKRTSTCGFRIQIWIPQILPNRDRCFSRRSRRNTRILGQSLRCHHGKEQYSSELPTTHS